MGITKYSKGDIFIHRHYPHARRLVHFVSFNERKVTYTIQNIEIDKADYTPSSISEEDLDQYYYLSPSNILRTRMFIKY